MGPVGPRLSDREERMVSRKGSGSSDVQGAGSASTAPANRVCAGCGRHIATTTYLAFRGAFYHLKCVLELLEAAHRLRRGLVPPSREGPERPN